MLVPLLLLRVHICTPRHSGYRSKKPAQSTPTDPTLYPPPFPILSHRQTTAPCVSRPQTHSIMDFVDRLLGNRWQNVQPSTFFKFDNL